VSWYEACFSFQNNTGIGEIMATDKVFLGDEWSKKVSDHPNRMVTQPWSAPEKRDLAEVDQEDVEKNEEEHQLFEMLSSPTFGIF